MLVRLDPNELDFATFARGDSEAGDAGGLERIGFRGYLRSDLAPSIQWLLFVLILVETMAAARLSIKWGAR